MATFQSFNNKTNAWVKYKLVGNRSIIIDTKTRNPDVPFKGVPIRRGK